METYGFLTILAISIAGYRALSDEKRLDIHIRFAWYDWVLLSSSVIVVLYIVYIPVLESLNLLIPLPWHFGFDEDTTSFTALLFIIFYLGIKLSSRKLPGSKMRSWERKADRLLKDKQFKELAYLFDRYHNQIYDRITNDTWFVRLRNWVAPTPPFKVLALQKERSNNTNSNFEIWLFRKVKPLFQVIRSRISKFFPKESKNTESLRNSVSKLLKSRKFVEFMIVPHSLVLMNATQLRFRGNDEFITTFLKELISLTDGPLYRELRDNQICNSQHQYVLDDSNQLLCYLFKDVTIAKNLGVWKPIGDYILEYIAKQKGKNNIYNESCGWFIDGEDRWHCPIFVTCFFFDIMVSEAISRRIEDHMWLLYFNHFTDEILKVIDDGDSVNTSDEFPNGFDYLIYNMVSICRCWVSTAQHLDYSHNEVGEIKSYPEYWAASCLGRLLRQIMNGYQTDKQKVYYLEMILRTMNNLDNEDLTLFSNEIINSCFKEHSAAAIDTEVKNEVLKHYASVDHILKIKDSTFEKSI